MRTPLAAAMIVAAILVGPSAQSQIVGSDTVVEVVPRETVTFQPLNPARGDAGPQAGTLWGDLRQDASTGAIVVFVPGFSSPPHIHNVSYRAVVIGGAVHNDDPQAEPMWMEPGSFWTQPAGEVHITAAAAESGPATIFLEIDEGPYLVQPFSEAFFNGRRPINISAGNIVWLGAADIAWVTVPDAGTGAATAELAFLWGKTEDGERNGTFLKLSAGFEGVITVGEAILRAVVIQGETEHQVRGITEATILQPGSYFGTNGSGTHDLRCVADQACILYISTEGRYGVAPS